jgi:hypothetical protein
MSFAAVSEISSFASFARMASGVPQLFGHFLDRHLFVNE